MNCFVRLVCFLAVCAVVVLAPRWVSVVVLGGLGACFVAVLLLVRRLRGAGHYFERGNALLEAGEYAQACEEYAKAIEASPRDSDTHVLAYTNWGRALRELGQVAQARVKTAKGVVKYTLLEPDGASDEDLACVGLEIVDGVEHPVAKGFKLYPRDALTYWYWGVALAKLGRHAEACEKCAKAIEVVPGHAGAYVTWAHALAEMGKRAEAEEKLGNAADLNPELSPQIEELRKQLLGCDGPEGQSGDPQAYFDRGNALLGAANYAEACEHYARALELNPRSVVAYYDWGIALANLGRYAEACEKYEKAVEIDPRFADAYFNWGIALGELGRHADACHKYAKAAELNRRDARAYSNWGNALSDLGQYAEACEKYAKAVEISPHHAEACANWGVALARMGTRDEAEQKWSKAAELSPALKPQIEEMRKKLLGKE